MFIRTVPGRTEGHDFSAGGGVEDVIVSRKEACLGTYIGFTSSGGGYSLWNWDTAPPCCCCTVLILAGALYLPCVSSVDMEAR